ncbi:MAG TPA: cation diffusion facilitator family transporter [Rhizomicrobium sp.]|jgi:cation diffusion facilitator family transporter|nr:cation diffusion facilitator family transporter [Rhizomicrobium sp.]
MAHHDHAHDHGLWTHDHLFLGRGHAHAERRARAATLLTAVFMVVEITAGLLFRSMALLADGVHMATHVGALGLAAGAYWLARRHAANSRFTFGSGKFGDLAAFSSAIVLGLIAIGVAAESIARLLHPVAIAYSSALPIAGVGLLVNLASAFILQGREHDHGHGHDHNLRAAYVHVVADAATSVLAIAALAAGLLFGLRWLDPIVGIAGALVIASWSYGLIRDSAMVLLDAETDPALSRDIRGFVEAELGARVADLHLWRVGPGHHSLIVSLVSPGEITAEDVKARLRQRHPDLSHVTVEVAVCADCPPEPPSLRSR